MDIPQLPVPRPEYPRPDFDRSEVWSNLNGVWDFEFDPDDTGIEQRWYEDGHTYSRQILVPFPWQSLAAWQQADQASYTNYCSQFAGYSGTAWYKRRFRIPGEFFTYERIILKFGAVDWQADIWVNGDWVGAHEGGYSQFEFDITDYVTRDSENCLVVRVWDAGETTTPSIDALPHGKQGGRWFTPSSGIWQTVWLEPRNNEYIEKVHITPDVDSSSAHFHLCIAAHDKREPVDCRVRVSVRSPLGCLLRSEQPMTLHETEQDISFAMTIPSPILWSPDQPALYDVCVILTREDGRILDKVNTYFGMRKISTGLLPGTNYKYLYLNNEPIYIKGTLVQSYNPVGVYTYPTDDYLRRDIEWAKKLGFNLIRLHIKVDEPRFMYWADRLGIMLWEEAPNFGDAGYNDAAKERWKEVMFSMIDRDFNHPATVIWGCFNETWGLMGSQCQPGSLAENPEKQAFVEEMYHAVKKVDGSRLVVDNSACRHDHVITDINDWHYYTNDEDDWNKVLAEIDRNTYEGSPWNYVAGRCQDGAPLLNSEYAGLGREDWKHWSDHDISWSFKFMTERLRLHEKIAGYVYCELQDIEWETSCGLMRYDRILQVFGYWGSEEDPFSPSRINADDLLIIDRPLGSLVRQGDRVTARVYLSHFGQAKGEYAHLTWRLEGTDKLGRSTGILRAGTLGEVRLRHLRLTELGTIEFTVPATLRVGCLTAELIDQEGKQWLSNYVTLAVEEVPSTALDISGEIAGEQQRLHIAFAPGDVHLASWSGGWSATESQDGAAWGLGVGYFEYRKEISLPPEFFVSSGTIVAELASRQEGEPQTDYVYHRSSVEIFVNDLKIGAVELPDDPADSRGVLSQVNLHSHGRYGYRVCLDLDPEQLRELSKRLSSRGYVSLVFKVSSCDAHSGGLTIYGRKLGRYGIAPSIILCGQ